MAKDVVILLLGQTGAGKSTFINHAAGDEVAETGDGTVSCTQDIQDFPLPLLEGNKRIHLIDTPGLGDYGVGDLQVFEEIRRWLVKFHKDNTSFEFAGTFYLYDISQEINTVLFDSSDTFNVFGLPPLVETFHFITTHRTSTARSTALMREKELQKNHLKPMLKIGAKVSRFNDSTASATAIISKVLNQYTHDFKTVFEQFDKIQQNVSTSSSTRPQRNRGSHYHHGHLSLRSTPSVRTPNGRLIGLAPLHSTPAGRTSKGVGWTYGKVPQVKHVSTVRTQRTTTSVHQSTTTIMTHEAHVDASAKQNDAPPTSSTKPLTAAESAEQNTAVVLERTCSVEARVTETASSKTTTVTATGSQIFEESHDFEIGNAVMNGVHNGPLNNQFADNRKITNNIDEKHLHLHFAQTLDRETLRTIIVESLEQMCMNVETTKDGAHIHRQTANVTTSSKKEIKSS